MAYILNHQTPYAGSISWSNVHIVFDGVDHAIANGSTNLKYVYWSPSAPTTLQATGEFPNLGAEDAIVFLNRDGVGVSVLDSAITDGGLIVPGTITSTAIATGAITADHIMAGAINVDHLDANSISGDKLMFNTIEAINIASNAIETTHINAGAVTSDLIASNAITTGKIAAGAVSAAQIAAGAITTDKLSIGAISNNLVSNPSAEDGAIGWQIVEGGGYIDVSSGDKTDGKYCFRLVSTGTGAAGCDRFPVNPGDSYSVRFSMRGDVTSTNGIYVRFNQASDNWPDITNRDMGVHDFIGNGACDSVWVDYEFTYVAPAGVYWASLAFYDWGSAATYLLFDNVEVKKQTKTVDIADGAITSSKITTGAVTAGKIAAGSITSAEIAADTITANNIAAGAITAVEIATDTITANNIAAGAIGATEIAAGAITAGKIAAGAITATEIATDTITAKNIAAGAIGATEIAAGAITAGKIAAGSITSTEIAASTITGDKIAASTITSDVIASNAITTSKLTIGDLSVLAENGDFEKGDVGWTMPEITEGVILNDAVNSKSGNYVLRLSKATGVGAARNNLSITTIPGEQFYAEAHIKCTGTATAYVRIRGKNAAGAEVETPGGNVVSSATYTLSSVSATVSSASSVNVEIVIAGGTGYVYVDMVKMYRKSDGVMIEDGAITAAKIATGTITATQIATDTITSSNIAAGAITATEIAAAAITGAKIAAGTITASNIATNTITANEIAASTITGSKIAADAITSSHIAAGAITASEIAASAISATHISAGTITGDKLAANTITAKNMVIGDYSNIALDPNGDNGDPLFAGCSIISVTEGKAYQCPSATRDSLSDQYFTVDVGDQYYVQADMNWISGGTARSQIGLCIFDSSGGTIGWYAGASCSDTSPGWKTVGGSITIPSGAVKAKLWWQREGTNGDANSCGVWKSRMISFRRKNAGNLIVDGAITAAKIAAGTITATQIASNSIYGDRLVAGSIYGDKIAANTITAANIAAGTITANEIAAGTITASKLAAGTITGDKIAAGQTLSSPAISGGTLTLGSGNNMSFQEGGSIGLGKTSSGGYGGWGYNWNTIIYNDGHLCTNNITASGGTFSNITINDSCDVRGTIYAEKIVGDVIGMTTKSVTERALGGSIDMLNFNITGSGKARYLYTGPITISTKYSGSRSFLRIYVDGVQVYSCGLLHTIDQDTGTRISTSYTYNLPRIPINANSNNRNIRFYLDRYDSWVGWPTQDINFTISPQSSASFL